MKTKKKKRERNVGARRRGDGELDFTVQKRKRSVVFRLVDGSDTKRKENDKKKKKAHSRCAEYFASER